MVHAHLLCIFTGNFITFQTFKHTCIISGLYNIYIMAQHLGSAKTKGFNSLWYQIKLYKYQQHLGGATSLQMAPPSRPYCQTCGRIHCQPVFTHRRTNVITSHYGIVKTSEYVHRQFNTSLNVNNWNVKSSPVTIPCQRLDSVPFHKRPRVGLINFQRSAVHTGTLNLLQHVWRTQYVNVRGVQTVTPESGVTAGSIKKFLDQKQMIYEQGHTCLISTCPRHVRRKIKLTEVDKLFINSTTGKTTTMVLQLYYKPPFLLSVHNCQHLIECTKHTRSQTPLHHKKCTHQHFSNR